jgi:hypothetical protein
VSAPSRTFTIVPDASFEIALPFDQKTVFGRTRAPVLVTINGHSWRSTVTTIGGTPWLPLRQSNREAAGVREGVAMEVTVTLDTAPRSVDPPEDLRAAIEAAGAWPAWKKLSFTHQREHVEAIEGAKKPETRARRIAKCVAMLSA